MKNLPQFKKIGLLFFLAATTACGSSHKDNYTAALKQGEQNIRKQIGLAQQEFIALSKEVKIACLSGKIQNLLHKHFQNPEAMKDYLDCYTRMCEEIYSDITYTAALGTDSSYYTNKAGNKKHVPQENEYKLVALSDDDINVDLKKKLNSVLNSMELFSLDRDDSKIRKIIDHAEGNKVQYAEAGIREYTLDVSKKKQDFWRNNSKAKALMEELKKGLKAYQKIYKLCEEYIAIESKLGSKSTKKENTPKKK